MQCSGCMTLYPLLILITLLVLVLSHLAMAAGFSRLDGKVGAPVGVFVFVILIVVYIVAPLIVPCFYEAKKRWKATE